MIRLLGTFHKAGTVLWANILNGARRRNGLQLWFVNREEAPPTWDIAFDFSSTALFPMIANSPVPTRTVFCVRDPRDIIISGAYYHMKSTEAWLHEPRADLDGLTYQQKINALPDMQARFQFEMQTTARATIRDMMMIPVSAPDVTLTRLETLVEDRELAEFQRVFEFLQFDAERVEALKIVARNNSLFTKQERDSGHVRSGKSAQYLQEFSAETLAMYQSLYPGVAGRLGYPE